MKNNKGFALMEILAVAVVVASIFMVIYSNFFPLKAELDNRVLYNDTEATYRAFYFKKIITKYDYKNFEYTNNYIPVCHTDNNDIIYDKTQIFTDPNDKNLIENLCKNFELDELILLKTEGFNIANYSGKLTKYLNYVLPSLDNNDEDDNYYIILKLKSGEYATLSLSSESIYIIINNIITGIKGEKTPNKNLSIPKSINGNDIIGIGDNVFKEQNIESLKLSDTITTIGESAFKNNKIKTLVIPSNVTTIKESAFEIDDSNENSEKMKRLVINLSNNTSIEASAFAGNDFYKTTFSDDDNSGDEFFNICAPTIMVKGGTANQEFNWCDILGITEEVSTNITGRSDACKFSSGDILNSDGTKVLYHIISNNENYSYEKLTSDQCTPTTN